MNIVIDFYCDNNLGDDLMGEALLDFLIEKGHTCYMLKRDDFILPACLKDRPVTMLDRLSEEEIRAYRLDTFIKIGGSMFPHGTVKEGILRYYEMAQIKKLKRRNLNVCIVNCNIGPMKTGVGRRATSKILKMADFVTCRDRATFDLIQKNKKNVYYYPDIILGLKDSGIMERKDDIGISVYTGYAPYLKQSNYRFSMFIAHFINLYHERKRGQRFLLFVFDTGYNSDFPTAYKILEYVKRRDMVEIVAYSSGSKMFFSRYKACRWIIGTRFHSIVLAWKYGIPVYPVIYSNKTADLLRDIHYKGPYMHITDCSPKALKQMMNSIEAPSMLTKDNKEFAEQSRQHFIQLGAFLDKCRQQEKGDLYGGNGKHRNSSL